MKNRKYIVSVIGEELFSQRYKVPEYLGTVIRNLLIYTLEKVGTEVDTGIADARIGVWLESKNPGVRKFELDWEDFEFVENNYWFNLRKALKEFSVDEQKKGTNVLFQLNSGKISMEDFTKNL